MHGTVSLCAHQDAGMKCMLHGPVAEKESQSLCLVLLRRKIDVEFCGSRQHAVPYCRVHAVVSVQYARNRGNADLGGGRDLLQAEFTPSGRLLCHAALRLS